uniref:F-box domain-containing protein n=1 Tax=Plectus sambesii TaxID=2011161 RepID=A0A914WP80_9BILA
MMISVTAAVRGIRGKGCKPSGAHFKAFGSGRRPLINEDVIAFKSRIRKRPVGVELYDIHKRTGLNYLLYLLWTSLLNFLLTLLSWTCPFAFHHFVVKNADLEASRLLANAAPIVMELQLEMLTGFQKLTDLQLKAIFKLLDVSSLINSQLVCERWNRVILANIEEMPKQFAEQIKLHFDEGEVIVSPANVHSQPKRMLMPPVNQLAMHLRHMTTSSLFIRGLIEIETRPVLSALSKSCISLRPSEVYFLWCNFATDGRRDLMSFLRCHRKTISDLGFEECYPSDVICDKMINSVGELSSLRIWSDGRRGRYEVTDSTLIAIANQLNPFHTIDLSNASVGVAGLVALIKAWSAAPNRDATICIGNCPAVAKNKVLIECANANIPLQSRGIRIGKHSLTLCCM